MRKIKSNETMKVAKYYNNSDVRIEEMPVPKIGSGELLVKVIASGICGSDVLEWYRIKKAPIVLGHEIAGDIVEVGSGVEKFKVGQRVFVSHHIPCNTCKYCLAGNHTACYTLQTTNFDPGGFAEYLRAPKLNVDRGVFVLPDSMSYDEGTFIEPLGCVVRGQRMAKFKPGQSVLVIGSGISGLLHIALAKALGAGNIIATDVNPYRLEAAKKFGANTAINAKEDVPAKVRNANNGNAVDLVIVCAGALSAFEQALKSVDKGGTVEFFATTDPDTALTVPINEFWRNSVTLLPSYGAAPYDIQVAIDLIANKRIPVAQMITHKLPLSETAKGFKLVAEAKDSIKVIVEPQK
jgi:L-iditol 2-dehydrogenase